MIRHTTKIFYAVNTLACHGDIYYPDQVVAYE